MISLIACGQSLHLSVLGGVVNGCSTVDIVVAEFSADNDVLYLNIVAVSSGTSATNNTVRAELVNHLLCTDYRRHTLALVKSGHLDDVPLSLGSFRKYLELKPFDRLNRRIASVNQAEIYPVSVMSYLPVLESFGLETLGDVQRFIDENSEDAYQLALSQLAITDLDILASNTGLQHLCLVYVLKHNGGREGLKSVYDIINGQNETNEMLADLMLEQAKTLSFMQEKK